MSKQCNRAFFTVIYLFRIKFLTDFFPSLWTKSSVTSVRPWATSGTGVFLKSFYRMNWRWHTCSNLIFLNKAAMRLLWFWSTISVWPLFTSQVEQLTKDWSESWRDKKELLEQYSVDINEDRAGFLISSLQPHLIALDGDVLSTRVVFYHLKVRQKKKYIYSGPSFIACVTF